MNRLAEGTKILFFTIFASIIYGWLHDLVTAHISPEYFLPPYHVVIIPTQSPIHLALIWGVVATWWMGAFFGFLLALAATIGKNPLAFAQLKKPITLGLLAVLIAAYLYLAINLSRNPDEIDAVLATHKFSYAACSILAGALIAWTIYRRRNSKSP